MKKNILLFLSVSFLVSSCKDDYSTHIVRFHGSIILGCDSTPVSNASVEIYRTYDTGSGHSESIGQTTTNSNGDYSLTASVAKDGELTGYHLGGGVNLASYTISFSGEPNNYVNESTSDVLIDGLAVSKSPITYHIKNVSPINSNDLFNELSFKANLDPSNAIGYYSLVNNLYGTAVDTSVTFSQSFLLSDNQQSLIRYRYTKNSVLTIKYDTVAGACRS